MVYTTFSLSSLLLVVLTAFPVACLADAEQSVGRINQFTSSLREAHQALESYGNGKVTGYAVAKKFDVAHRAAKQAQQSLVETGPLSGPEAVEVARAYNQMYPEAVGVLGTMSENAPAMKRKLGVGYVAHGIVSTFHNDKNDFHDALRERLPEEQQRTLSPNMDNMDRAFEEALRAVSN